MPKHAANNKHQKQTSRGNCDRCRTTHSKKKCPAFGQKCQWCGNMNHYQSLCWSKTVATGQVDDESDQYEICTVGEQPGCVNKALVNLYVNWRQPGNDVRFQVGNGSECHLLPLKVYKSITGDNTAELLRKCNKLIFSYSSNRANRMGLKYAASNKAEQNSYLFGPKGSERSEQVRALPDAQYRRGHYSTWQSKAFHSSECNRRILADHKPSYKTTFNIPFGRYHWLQMPFGISSTPEVWQRTVHEFVEGLQGVEVIVDDFIIAGFGDTTEEAYKSHLILWRSIWLNIQYSNTTT